MPKNMSSMWRLLQHNEPDTFVLATGVTSSVREFAASAALAAGIGLNFRKDQSEVGRNTSNGEIIFKVNPDFFGHRKWISSRGLCKGQSNIRVGSINTCRDLCKMMVEADINRNQITG